MTAVALAPSEDMFGTGPSVRLEGSSGQRTLWWGQPWQWATAAYWCDQARRCPVTPGQFRLGATIEEELVACILGGFGMPAAVGLAAFASVRKAGLIGPHASPQELEAVLRVPMAVGGRQVRYRFPRQRSSRVADALNYLHLHPLPADPVAARDALMNAPGVGPKTASWIVRNQFDSDSVAIIDIHICRAGEAAGVFDRSWNLARQYQRYESYFLAWAERGDVRPSMLDAFIWAELARVGSTELPSRHP